MGRWRGSPAARGGCEAPRGGELVVFPLALLYAWTQTVCVTTDVERDHGEVRLA
jgi:hypothetical protein